MSQKLISHQTEVLFVGSCFSEHIANKLVQLKFDTSSNPFGIIFNPISIINILNRMVDKNYFTNEDIFEKNGLWFCWDTHTSIFATSKMELLLMLNDLVNQWHLKLQTAKWLIITTGSAYVYKHIEQKKMVANCHKLPHYLFEKHLLNVTEIENKFDYLISKLKKVNAEIQILFTVSPVKHLRDGVIENSVSKSTLILTTHYLINKLNCCDYFPAYELVNDDLRDYRFYETDLAHPNKQAIDYVWQKFETTFFDDKTKLLNEKLNDINNAFNHIQIQGNTTDFILFKKKYFDKCLLLKQHNPHLNLEVELNYFKS